MEVLETLKSLGDLNRLRILKILKEFGKSCNCDLEEVLELNQSNASRHLTKLRKDKLILCEKKGQWSYYTINNLFFSQYPFINYLLDSLKDDIFIQDKDKFINFLKNKNYCL